MTKKPESRESKRIQTLAAFRYTIRQFLQFSEQRALEAGLQPQQHQLMLHIAGAPQGIETTVSYAAERLGLRHHSVVELSKRCELAGLIHRQQADLDRRRIVLKLTPLGQRIIRALSDDHERELSELVPTLIHSLTQIRRHSTKSANRTRSENE